MSAAQLQAARQRRLNKPHPAIIPDGIAAQLLAGAFDDEPVRLPQPELWPNYIARHAGSFSALGFTMVLISAWQLWRLPPQAIMEGKVIPTDWKIFGETNVSDHIAAKRLPRLLRGSPAASWRAVNRWTPAYLSSKEWTLSQVWQSDQPVFVYSSAEGELGGLTKMLPPAENASAIVHMDRSMRAADFFGGDGLAPYRYYQDEASALGAALLDDLKFNAIHAPTDPFDAFTVHADADGVTEAPAALAWIGTEGCETQAHYDQEHNFFVQLYGRKTFYLWPPDAHEELRLFPTRHPRHRQSSLVSPWLFQKGVRPPIVAELEPGDVLYNPPFWLHHVRAASNFSASISIWTPSAEARRRAAIERLPLPWEADWPEETTTLAAAQLCRALFLAIHGGEVAARTALRKQLRQYDVLRSFPKSEWSDLVPPLGRHDFLGPMGAEMAAMCDDADERKRLNQAVARAVPALVAAVRAVSSDHAVQAIALSNYVEALAHFVVGREKIQPFLDVCIWGDGPWEP